ncbi:telomeric repeat-binding factor 2-interacting protein 1 isoform X1 [Chaetodon trifascialis]|uniref:telomeric repeat-binding factor 2-interacting protein 1 isoform X1 n=1 Tax=Chaetodon trifascialis TaxID=109706 RepID=UPI003995DFF6
MASKQQDVAKPNISPVLFMAVDGEPMSFFLRPGPVKRKLQPLITAGGGMLSNVQQPGAILLIDPEERGSLAETAAHRYVSTQYIHDCIERDEQLNLEDYKLNPEVVPRHSARLNNNKESCPGGRVAYTTEDDAAILSYVSEHKAETGGNRLWQEMEKQRVTSHSWQSMKYRYRVRLAKKQSEAVEVPTTEAETKVEGDEGTDAEKPSSSEDAASPQTHTTESDLTQIDQPIPAEHTQPEIVEAQTSIGPQGEEQHVSPQTSKQPADGTQVETVEAETSDSPQPEGACLDPPTDAQPIPAESTEPETDAPQTVISPQKESLPEDSPPAQPNSLPDSSSKKKPKEKQKSSPRLEQPQRRSTRRQLQLEDSALPELYGKKLRSSLSSAEQLSASPQPSNKTKSAHKSALQKDSTGDEAPSKRAKGKSAAESKQETSGQDSVSEATRAESESNSTPQKGGKKKEKRKLGILELATKEFEDESESGEDEAPDLQNPTETATVQPTSTEPRLQTPDTAASAQAGPERGPGLQEKVPEAQASSSNHPPPTGCPEPAATEPAAVSAASKAHLFIFDSESQEEGSQSMFGDSTAAPANLQPTVNKDAAFSLTQVQLEEDKQRITELMRETKQDLVSVTKALLKTSGDFSAALDLLLNPFAVSGPFWKLSDDGLLLSGDPVVRQELQERYGEEKVAKRVMFLELEG